VKNIGYVDPRYTFDNFVVAANNESCVLASRLVVDQPGEACNPLYIYGSTGLGKTHLMNAIANALNAKGHISIVSISTESFVTFLIASVRNGTTQAFRRQYQNTDAFMIDDLQFIAGRVSLQEELLCTFNALYDLKKQIVLTSTFPPDDCAKWSASMRARFTSGLITEMNIPSLETRLLILAKKAEASGFSLDDDVAHMLASRCTTDIRELEGAWIRLTAHASLTNKTINLDFAKHVLKNRWVNSV
jgi:chromosomal replication initiator protein